MVRRGIGAAAIVIVAAILVIWWHSFGSDGAQATAQTPAPAIPVTAGTVAAQDVPVYLHGIGTVQAYNMVAIKTRVDGPDRQGSLQGRPGGQGGRPAFPDRSAALSGGARTGPGGEAKGRGPARRRQCWTSSAIRSSSAPAIRPGRATTTRTRWSAQLQAAIKGDQAQIDNAQLNLGYADIRSPIDGRLGARLVDIGNLVHANDNTGAGHDHPAEADLRQLYVAAETRSTTFANNSRRRRSSCGRTAATAANCSPRAS